MTKNISEPNLLTASLARVPALTGYRLFAAIFVLLYLGIYLRHFLLFVHLELALIADVAVYLFLPIFLIVILYTFRRDAILKMAGDLKWSWVGFFVSVLLGFVCAPVLLQSITRFQHLINFSLGNPIDLPRMVINQFGLIGVFYLAITAGFFEEWLYKSVLIRSFRKEPSRLMFVTTSAVLFGLAHWWQGPVSTIVITLLIGLPTAIYYYEKRNISNLIVIHTVIDLLIFRWMLSSST